MIRRYATPGAVVNIYLLHSRTTYAKPVAQVVKAKGAKFQPPNCSLPCLNGVILPFIVHVPLEPHSTD